VAIAHSSRALPDRPHWKHWKTCSRSFAEKRSPALKGWANVGCRCATAIVQTAQRSWARIGEPCEGLVTLGLERDCLDRRKGLNPGSLSAFLLSRSDYRS
jgi:hypothetical protein